MSMCDFYGEKKIFKINSHLSSLVQSNIYSLSRALPVGFHYINSSSNPSPGQSLSHATALARVLHFILGTALCGNTLVHTNNHQDS